MKIAEIKEMTTNDLVERVEAETANYNQMVINHSISSFGKSCSNQTITQDYCAYETELRERELNNK